MKRFFLLFLLTLPFTIAAETSSSLKKPHQFTVPWKQDKHELYKDQGPLAMKQGAGLSLSDFLGLEGSRYNFDYFQSFRYSPLEGQGFMQESSQAFNLQGVGKLPLSNSFTLFGKFGPSYYQPSSDIIDTEFFPSVESAEDLGLSYSTGASINLNPRLKLSLEYLRTENEQLQIESGIAQMSWNF